MKDYWDRIIDKELEQRLEAKAKPSLLLRGENPRLKMYPMSLYESRESSGEISLKELFDNPWLDIDGIMRNSTLAEIILRSYARNLSALAKKVSIYRDVVVNMESLSMPTLDSYIAALERLFVIEDIDAWCPAIRSATTIRSGKKRAFIDPSIAVAAMGLTPDYLEKDLRRQMLFCI